MKGITQFLQQGIKNEEALTIKGGGGDKVISIFCEWYVGYCERKGVAVDTAVLEKLAGADAVATYLVNK